MKYLLACILKLPQHQPGAGRRFDREEEKMPTFPFRAWMLAVQLLLTLIYIPPLSVSGAPLWPVPTTQSLGTGVLWLPDKLPFTVAVRNAVSTTGSPFDLSSDHDAYHSYRRRYTQLRTVPEPSLLLASLMMLSNAPRTTSTMTPSSRGNSTRGTRSLNQTSTAQRQQLQG